MFDQKRNSGSGRGEDPDPATVERIRLLEAALAEYVERYGLSELARKALAQSHGR